LLYSAQKQDSHVPLVFSAVSDPKAAKLISETYPITGVSDEPNLEGLMELMNKMLPKLKVLGLMYNPAEANSVSTIHRLKKMLEKQGIKPYEVTVNKSSDVAQAMQSIIGKVDALYFPQDNTMVSAIETVASIAQHSSPTLPVILPIFTSDTTLIKRGILAAVGFDYVDIGKTTGQVVTRVLNGEDAHKIPIQTPEELKAVVNKALAKKLGISIPTDLKYSKVQVVE
jgi:putative ABC transport system substrate-binding protein